MDISPWKIMGGVALAAALLLAPLAGDATAKNRSRRKAQAEQQAPQEATISEVEKVPTPPALATEQTAPSAPAAGPTVSPAAAVSPAAYVEPMPQSTTTLPANGPFPTSSGEYVYDDNCDTGDANCPRMKFCDRMKYCDQCFKCWKMNHCPWCCCAGCRGERDRSLRNSWNFVHKGTYPADINYFDTRDIQVYSAQSTAVPTSVPLAPVVRYAYNDGWGVPASRITTVGSTYNRWYPQEFYAFAQKNTPGPVGPDGRRLPQHGPVPPPVAWPTDTTQHGYYYKHVPQWQPAQRTRWSNIPGTLGVQAPLNPSVNLTPYPLQPPATGFVPAPAASPAPVPVQPVPPRAN